MLPIKHIKAFHIHYKHRMPDLSNEIPWKKVFSLIKKIEENIIINPEIHHKNKVEDTIGFCNKMLSNTKEFLPQKSINDFL